MTTCATALGLHDGLLFQRLPYRTHRHAYLLGEGHAERRPGVAAGILAALAPDVHHAGLGVQGAELGRPRARPPEGGFLAAAFLRALSSRHLLSLSLSLSLLASSFGASCRTYVFSSEKSEIDLVVLGYAVGQK